MFTSCPPAVRGWRVFGIPAVINARRAAHDFRPLPERHSSRMPDGPLARRYLARLGPHAVREL